MNSATISVDDAASHILSQNLVVTIRPKPYFFEWLKQFPSIGEVNPKLSAHLPNGIQDYWESSTYLIEGNGLYDDERRDQLNRDIIDKIARLEIATAKTYYPSVTALPQDVPFETFFDHILSNHIVKLVKSS